MTARAAGHARVNPVPDSAARYASSFPDRSFLRGVRCLVRVTWTASITLYNSVGIGLQDLAAARILIDTARQRGVGTEVDLSR
ncbi:hypothetical protein [Rhodococcus sp. NCIMB 12038]|uniref:hypothetical protein n=1 Tax=Rhodococcus sp. NCIMB 12038 TaxID=933800 RepID=UPI00211B698F|nr:hypothetical protein [Rhodococcus sp. NCIMB 12038]